jgi:N-acetylglutamate synthase-like GNAT family acetyltransferase
MKTRLARPADVEAISRLILTYADRGLLLPRGEEQVRQSLNNFLVLTERADGNSPDTERLLGCVALEPYGADLAEIRSLAVDSGWQGLGLGGKLIDAALGTAKRRKIARVFAVTHVAGLFQDHGFGAATRQELPEKIARDCSGCPKARNCELVTLVAVVCPERITQQVLAPAGAVPVLV